MSELYTSGNKGDKIRSDCYVSFEPASSGGIRIELSSKVKIIYGEAINKLAQKTLRHLGIDHCTLKIEDSGALDFVISARIEAAVGKFTKDGREFLPQAPDHLMYSSKKDRFRISRLYLPGNTPSMMINAGIHKPNGIILDLEDSVSPAKKEEARILVRNALRSLNFYGAEKMVRINQVPAGIRDLSYAVPHGVHLILIPKVEKAEDIIKVEEEIKTLKEQSGRASDVYLMPILESAIGIENAYSIATASGNIVAMAIGLEDYTADIGAPRTPEGKESFYARSRMVNACKAAGIQAIDSVFSDVDDEAGLRRSIKESKSLGYEGMGCIHPRQIPVIHEAYAPEPGEIEKAEKIVDAFMKAEEEGSGVIALGSKMIDPPVVKRAGKIIDLAIKTGLINSNWREKYVSE